MQTERRVSERRASAIDGRRLLEFDRRVELTNVREVERRSTQRRELPRPGWTWSRTQIAGRRHVTLNRRLTAEVRERIAQDLWDMLKKDRRVSSRRLKMRDGRRSGFERRVKNVDPGIDYRNHDVQRRFEKRRVVVDRRSPFR